MTIDGWRSSRDEEGWKLPAKELEAWRLTRCKKEAYREEVLELDHGDLKSNDGLFSEGMLVKEDDWTWEAEVEEEGPTTVLIKDRLRDDLACITRFLASPTPPTQSIRGREKSNGVESVVYGFMDAAKYGFGDAFDQPGQDLQFNFGLWKASIATENLIDFCGVGSLPFFCYHIFSFSFGSPRFPPVPPFHHSPFCSSTFRPIVPLPLPPPSTESCDTILIH